MSMSPHATAADTDEEQPEPVDIRARVAAFEKRSQNGGASPAPPPPRPISPAMPVPLGTPAPGASIARVHSTPRSREQPQQAPLYHQQQAVSEFGAVPTSATTSARQPYSASTSPTKSLSPFSAAYRGAGAPHSHTIASHSSAHSSSFEDLARAGQHLNKSRSGTSLADFTATAIRGARERVSDKVPLPPASPYAQQSHHPSSSSLTSYAQHHHASSSSSSSSLPYPHTQHHASSSSSSSSLPYPHKHHHSSSSTSSASSLSGTLLLGEGGPSTGGGTASGRSSPALPPRHMASAGYARTSASSPHLLRSTISRHPLDDSEDADLTAAAHYSLALHPALHPTASPLSSRAPSRAESKSSQRSQSRSVPASPRASPQNTGGSGLSLSPLPDIGDGHPILPPRHHSHSDGPAHAPPSASEATTRSASFAVQARSKQAPALPPRSAPASKASVSSFAEQHQQPLPYVPYKPRGGSGSGPSSSSGVASKVPLPPAALGGGLGSPSLNRPSVPPPIVPPRPQAKRHSPSASVGSSPAHSPRLAHRPSLAFPPHPGHRASRSGPDPGMGLGVGLGLGGTPSASASAESLGVSPNAAAVSAAPRSTGPGQAFAGLTALQPPPSRHRSSSVGPGGAGAAVVVGHSRPGAAKGSPAPRNVNVFHGSPAYRKCASEQRAQASGAKRRGAGAGRGKALSVSLSMEPRDEAARRRYEAVWEREVRKQREREARRGGTLLRDKLGGGPGADDTIRQGQGQGRGTVASLARRFQASTAGASVEAPPPGDTSDDFAVARALLPPRAVARLWRKSRLGDGILADVWASAAAFQAESHSQSQSLGAYQGQNQDMDEDVTPTTATSSFRRRRGRRERERGLGKEAFVRALAGIDAELALRRASGANVVSKASAPSTGSKGLDRNRTLRSTGAGTGSPARTLRTARSASAGLTGAGGAAGDGTGGPAAGRRVPPPAPALPTTSPTAGEAGSALG